MAVKYPEFAQELTQLLQDDQAEKKAVGRAFLSGDASLATHQATLKANTAKRTRRMLQIFEAIGEPSISNIGSDGALAISVLASHDSLTVVKTVLRQFEALYARNRSECRYESIPAMADLVLVCERKPQRFGTQCFFDASRYPFLPLVEDFEHLNDRRAEYDLGPLQWPKSMAIPESEQPWLSRPLSELVVREPTEEEYASNLGR